MNKFLLKTIKIFISLLIIVFFISNYSKAQDESKSNLKNVNKLIFMFLMDNTQNINYTPLDTELIKTKIELRLRTAGIKVYENNSYNFSKFPVLVTYIYFMRKNFMDIPDEYIYYFTVSLKLYEYLNLPRAHIKNYLCNTWDRSFYATCNGKDYPEEVNKGIESLLNIFMNDYLRDNPK